MAKREGLIVDKSTTKGIFVNTGTRFTRKMHASQ